MFRAPRLSSHPLRNAALLLAALVPALMPAAILAQASADWRARNQPTEPYKVVGNLYSVGASDVTSFLFVTPAGDILLDGGFVETAPIIRANVETLGFHLKDVKILLNTHAHTDHAGGLAQLRSWSGAAVWASERDAPLLEGGGRGDFAFGDSFLFPPVHVDRKLRDGDTVSLGGTTLTAHLTPGHTRGSITWTTTIEEKGKAYRVVVAGSLSINPGVRLLDRPSYPGIAADYEHSFAVLKALPVDIFLAPHASFYDGLGKAARLRAGAKENPFVDPKGFHDYLAEMEAKMRKQLAEEKAQARR